MTEAVIFDMDGVLIDSQPLHFEGDRRTLQAYGVEVPFKELEAYAGTTDAYRFSRWKQKYHLNADLEEISRRRENIMIHLIRTSDAQATHGVRPLLRQIRNRKLLTAVASSSAMPFIKEVLHKIQVEEFFDLVFTGENVKHGKPAPDIFLKTAELLHKPAEQCIVIEDSHNGVEAACAAGMKCIGYRNPTSGEQDLSAADRIITDFADIDVDSILSI